MDIRNENMSVCLKALIGKTIGIMRRDEMDYWYAELRAVGPDYISVGTKYHIIIIPMDAVDSIRISSRAFDKKGA